MADYNTGWLSAGTGANVDRDSKNAWTTPENIIASDDSVASVSTAAGDYSDWLRASNFGFALPTDATIVGIEFRIERGALAPGNDSSLRLWDGTAVDGDDKATATQWAIPGDEIVTYGGAADDWNNTLTVTQINSSAFGIQLSVTNQFGAPMEVDHVELRIHYDSNVILIDTSTVAATTNGAVVDDGSPTLIQTANDATYNGSKTVSVSSADGWGTPTSGNLLIITYQNQLNSGGAGDQRPINWILPSGFTEVVEAAGLNFDDYNQSSGIAYKISDGTETSFTVSWTDTDSGGGDTYLTAFELSNMNGTVASSDSDIDSGTVYDLSVTPNNDNSFYVSCCSFDLNTSSTISWDNSFTELWEISGYAGVGYKFGSNEATQPLAITSGDGGIYGGSAVLAAFDAFQTDVTINVDTTTVSATTQDATILSDEIISVAAQSALSTTLDTIINAAESIPVDVQTVLSTVLDVEVIVFSGLVSVDLLTVAVTTQAPLINAVEILPIDAATVYSIVQDISFPDVISVDLLTISSSTQAPLINEQFIVDIDLQTVSSVLNDIKLNDEFIAEMDVAVIASTTFNVNIQQDITLYVDLQSASSQTLSVGINSKDVVWADLLTVSVVPNNLIVNAPDIISIDLSTITSTTHDAYALTNTVYPVGTSQNEDSYVGVLNVSQPTGIQTGNLMIATCIAGLYTYESDGPWTSSGWTLIQNNLTEVGTNIASAVFYRFVTDSEPSSYNFYPPSYSPCSVIITGFNGANQNQFDVDYVNSLHFNSGENVDNPTNQIITTQNDDSSVFIVHFASDDDIDTPGAPSGYTVIDSVHGSVMDNRQQVIAYKKVDTGQAEQPGAWTHTTPGNNVAEYHTYTLSIQNELANIDFVNVDLTEIAATTLDATPKDYYKLYTAGSQTQANNDGDHNGTYEWTNLPNVEVNDGNWSYAGNNNLWGDFAGVKTTDWMVLSNFGFNVPEDERVVGFNIVIEGANNTEYSNNGNWQGFLDPTYILPAASLNPDASSNAYTRVSPRGTVPVEFDNEVPYTTVRVTNDINPTRAISEFKNTGGTPLTGISSTDVNSSQFGVAFFFGPEASPTSFAFGGGAWVDYVEVEVTTEYLDYIIPTIDLSTVDSTTLDVLIINDSETNIDLVTVSVVANDVRIVDSISVETLSVESDFLPWDDGSYTSFPGVVISTVDALDVVVKADEIIPISLLSANVVTNDLIINNSEILLIGTSAVLSTTYDTRVITTFSMELVEISTNMLDVVVYGDDVITVDLANVYAYIGDIELPFVVEVSLAQVGSAPKYIEINEEFIVFVDELISTASYYDVQLRFSDVIYVDSMISSVHLIVPSVLLINDGGENWWEQCTKVNDWSDKAINTTTWDDQSVNESIWSDSTIDVIGTKE